MKILLDSAQPTGMCPMTRLSRNSIFVTQDRHLKDLPVSPTVLTQEVFQSSDEENSLVAILRIISVITALPHYVSRVEGYSPASLRTYLNDNFGALLTSEVVYFPKWHVFYTICPQDGMKMTLVDQSNMPADLQPATVVPGLEAFTTVLAGVIGLCWVKLTCFHFRVDTLQTLRASCWMVGW